jgi:hypothetical protein
MVAQDIAGTSFTFAKSFVEEPVSSILFCESSEDTLPFTLVRTYPSNSGNTLIARMQGQHFGVCPFCLHWLQNTFNNTGQVVLPSLFFMQWSVLLLQKEQ